MSLAAGGVGTSGRLIVRSSSRPDRPDFLVSRLEQTEKKTKKPSCYARKRPPPPPVFVSFKVRILLRILLRAYLLFVRERRRAGCPAVGSLGFGVLTALSRGGEIIAVSPPGFSHFSEMIVRACMMHLIRRATNS